MHAVCKTIVACLFFLGLSGASFASTDAATLAAQVEIKQFAYNPNALSVKPGTTVTWKNSDSLPHTVTGDSDTPASGYLIQGQTYSFTFIKPGTYSYHCKIHPYMKGTVTVTP
jgi:amicyanin